MAEPVAPLVGMVTPRGVRIPADPLLAKLGGRQKYTRFLAALTVTESPQPGRPKVYARARRTAYAHDRSGAAPVLYVPRAKLLTLRRVAEEIRADPGPAPPRALPPAARLPAEPLYEYQEAAVDYVCAAWDAPDAHAVYMQMGTGMGKSRFGMAAAARAGGPVFVVVPTKQIRFQWLDEFAEVFPGLKSAPYDNPPKGSRKVPPGPADFDVVVGIVNTVRAKAPGFFAGYATVILDEAHEYHSPKNMAVLWLVQEVPKVLGLSATPDDRVDGLDRVVYHFLGPPVCAERDVPNFDIADVNFRGRVREVEYAGDPAFCETAVTAAGTVSAIETIGNLIRDPARLHLVAAEVERLFRLHETDPPPALALLGLGPRPPEAATEKLRAGEARTHGIFVFAEHREYLPALREALLERFAPEDIDIPEIDVPEDAPEIDIPEIAIPEPVPGIAPAAADYVPVVLRGGATPEDIGQAHRARIVLTTYGYSRRGVSLVDMTAIVLATPRRNGMRQILGRVTRRGSDESIVRLAVDIKDIRTALKGQSSDRRRIYKEKEYPIFRVRADFTDFAEAGREASPTAEEEPVWEPDGGDEAQHLLADLGDL